MSARKIWYPGESIVIELSGTQPTASESRSDGGSKNMEASDCSGASATLARSKQKIARRRTPTVDTNNLRSNCTSSKEKLDTDECGRGMELVNYSTIEDTGHASTMTLLSNLMQRAQPALSKDTNFHGWLPSDSLLQWRNIFLPKLEQSNCKNIKDTNRTRRHRSEEFVFHHCKDISEYMKYYRKHCCLTSLSVPSLKRHGQKSTSKQDMKSMRQSTRGVFRTIDDSATNKQEQSSIDKKEATLDNSSQEQHQNPRLAELESKLNLTASVISFPSRPLPLVPKPTPPSIVNRESTSIVLCGSGSSSCEKYYKDDNGVPSTQNKGSKATVVKSASTTGSTGEGVELPPINNYCHSSSDTSINYLHVKQFQTQQTLITDSLVGAEGELEDHCFHGELDNISDPTLAASSVSIIQQLKSCTKLETLQASDEHVSSSTDGSWVYPYPYFQVPSSFRYDKLTREQLLSSKAHALGLVSSKNWIKRKKSLKIVKDDALLPTRIKSSPPGRMPKDIRNDTFVSTLEGVNEKLTSGKTKVPSSKETDTVHGRLKAAGANGHTIPTTQRRPTRTTQGNRGLHHEQVTSGTRYNRPQGKKQYIPPAATASKISRHKKRLTDIYHNQQLSSNYIGQVNERLQGILKVKNEDSTFIPKSSIAAS